MPCRFNRRRLWTNRILLESKLFKDNCFITLTYSDDQLKFVDGLPTLVAEDFQLFLKRFRRDIEPLRIRYFGCGEYGDVSQRPHYHAILFGWPVCSLGNSELHRDGRLCPSCSAVSSAWGKGLIHIGSLSPQSAGYVAGYVTKKLTAKDDTRLRGREPEFSRMSRRPGIGFGAMEDIASTLLEIEDYRELVDVPTELRTEGRKLPIGRYLRRRLRILMGRSPDTPEVVRAQMALELQDVYENSRKAPQGFRQAEFKRLAVEKSEGQFRNFEARRAIFKQEKKL